MCRIVRNDRQFFSGCSSFMVVDISYRAGNGLYPFPSSGHCKPVDHQHCVEFSNVKCIPLNVECGFASGRIFLRWSEYIYSEKKGFPLSQSLSTSYFHWFEKSSQQQQRAIHHWNVEKNNVKIFFGHVQHKESKAHTFSCLFYFPHDQTFRGKRLRLNCGDVRECKARCWMNVLIV